MAELEQRDMVQQKRQKAAEKLRVRLGDVIIDPEGRLGRYYSIFQVIVT